MTVDADAARDERRPFEADVAKLLHLMVHSVYSDPDVFLRELISNAADACEKLRYEAIAEPALMGEDTRPRIVVRLDETNGLLSIEDNGIGMSRDDMIEALGTIARSGTRAFMEKVTAAGSGGAELIGQFGVGFYSAFMVADRVDVVSRRAGASQAQQWTSDGLGAFTVREVPLEEAPARGTRVVLHLKDDKKHYLERWTIERIVKAQSAHVPVPITLVEKPEADPVDLTDGGALWAKSKADVSADDYKAFYATLHGAFDEPALTVHFRAEGRHEYTTLAFVPSSKPLDLFAPERKGLMKLYVRRVFISDDVDLLPAYLRFVRGIVDSADLPLNISREMIQQSPILAAIRKGVTGRVLADLGKLAETDANGFTKVWETFGPVIKEGLYEDYERRDTLLDLARFRSTSGADWRSLKQYVADLKPNQTAIYYLAGGDLDRLRGSPQLEGFAARGIEVLLLPDPVDGFWVTTASGYDGKPFRSVTQGAADLTLVPLKDEAKPDEMPDAEGAVAAFLAEIRTTLGDRVADVRPSDRLTESPVCLVASEAGPDRELGRILGAAGRLADKPKPILEVNPRHTLVRKLADSADLALRADAAHLLLDEAMVLDGEAPSDPRAFAERLTRVLARVA